MASNTTDNRERFVAFAFAAADLLVETDADGTITYAAGAFNTRFGKQPEALVGRPVLDIVVPADHDAVATAMALLAGSGRLLPMLVRLSDPRRTMAALAGLALKVAGGPPRLCLTFARPPSATTGHAPGGSAASFTRTMEARLRTGTPGSLGLLDVAGEKGLIASSGEMLDEVLYTAAPGAIASEIAPGRFGVLSAPGAEIDLLAIVGQLEEALKSQGMDVSVTAQDVKLARNGLNSSQIARALRQALNIFAREGAAGLASSGFAGGLAGYVHGAATKVESLRSAIREGRFSLLYQPVVRLSDRSVHHFEALIRPLPVPGCPFSNPQEFVTVVEALGLADELDLAVAAVACEAAARTHHSIAFNLSSQSVQDADFRDRLVKLLSASRACASGLMLVEMTETADVDNLEEATRTADALRALRVPFCLDDFGAGAADIRLLRSLTADIVKLDGSYVAGVSEDERERAFVAGMVEIARAAGVQIVAERVETEEEAAALAGLGVHFGQGWLFGRPAPLPLRRGRQAATSRYGINTPAA